MKASDLFLLFGLDRNWKQRTCPWKAHMAVYVTKETDIVLKFESVQMTTLFGLVVAVARHATAGRDSGKEQVETFLEHLIPSLETNAGLLEARRAIELWNRTSGALLHTSELPQTVEGDTAVMPNPSTFRVHCADIQLTFNHPWIPEGQTATGIALEPLVHFKQQACPLYYPTEVDEWWTVAGHVLVQRYLEWAMQTFPDRFQERILHTSLTIEESMHAVTPAIHLHAHFTFAKRVDRTQLLEKYLFDVTVCVELVICYLSFYKVPHSRNLSCFYLSCFKFGSIKPHIECNRGKDVFPSYRLRSQSGLEYYFMVERPAASLK